MPTTVHVHYYRGVSELPKVVNRQFAADSVLALHEPPISGQAHSVGPSASTLDAAPKGTRVARIQVESDGKVRYKLINESNDGQEADSDSPALTGEVMLYMEKGWSLSLIEA